MRILMTLLSLRSELCPIQKQELCPFDRKTNRTYGACASWIPAISLAAL